MTNDGQLLRQYTQDRSESAFSELVTRHIDLVYAAALRLVNGDSHLAEDVTQTVFTDLARKARSLPREVVLPGWLYRHACLTAAKAVRTERRRQTREQTAMEMKALDANSEPNWELVAPHLDEALNQLSEADRNAIVLRFLKRQEFRTIGAALGVSEDAAQKRVSRALEKLRPLLAKRGITSTAAGLMAVLATGTALSAPAGLAATVSTSALAAAAMTSSTITLLKIMTMTKLKAGIISAIIVAGVATPLVIQQHQTQVKLREENENLRRQADELTNALARFRDENERLAKIKVKTDEMESLRTEHLELLRLRGEVADLRDEIQAKTEESSGNLFLGTANSRTNLFVNLADVGQKSPEAALQTFLWALRNNTDRLAQVVNWGPRFTNDAQITQECRNYATNWTDVLKGVNDLMLQLTGEGLQGVLFNNIQIEPELAVNEYGPDNTFPEAHYRDVVTITMTPIPALIPHVSGASEISPPWPMPKFVRVNGEWRVLNYHDELNNAKEYHEPPH